MLSYLKAYAHLAVRFLGYDVHRVKEPSDPFADMGTALSSNSNPIIFDVGASDGRTIRKFRAVFPHSTIHAFEPGAFFRELETNVARANDIHLDNFALGARPETREFSEITSEWGPGQSSFLELDEDGYGTVISRTPVKICTIDDYCQTHKIDRIDVLKTDTQGFDLEVLKGAAGMFAKNAVRFVLVEINFNRWYKGQAQPDELFRFLYDRGFGLISFYNSVYARGFAEWSDALFQLRS